MWASCAYTGLSFLFVGLVLPDELQMVAVLTANKISLYPGSHNSLLEGAQLVNI